MPNVLNTALWTVDCGPACPDASGWTLHYIRVFLMPVYKLLLILPEYPVCAP